MATTTALEGIEVTPDVHCLSAETPESFAAALVRYLRDPERRARHGRAARALVEALYAAPRVFASLGRAYEMACEERFLARREAAV